MKIPDINSPLDILTYLENIKYGWLGSDDIIRINKMENFRTYYRTMSLKNIINKRIGTCIEQTYLVKYLLDKLNIKSKMFCTRVYEDETFNNMSEPERMHCFIIFFLNNKVFQIEHPNSDRKGIYIYSNEDEAISKIGKIYEEMTKYEYRKKGIKYKGKIRKITEFYEVKPNLSYKEFNNYINSLDKKE